VVIAVTSTPRYVHALLDTLLTGAPLNFHGQPVPPDVLSRITLTRLTRIPTAALPAPEPAAPATASKPATPSQSDRPALTTRAPLTERETQVLRGVADGASNNQIGEALFVSEDTVKTHMQRIGRKLGARNRAQAAAIGVRTGLIR
jgi:DNA-binding NarL/FixJ family response regulator